MHVRELARQIRDNALRNPLIRYPFSTLRQLGVRLPERLYRHLGFHGVFQVDTLGRGRFRMHSEGHVIENNVYWAGLAGYEPESMEPWITLASRSRVILDIGANTGLYSLVAGSASPAAEIHAFEPVPRVFARLRKNAALNSGFRITVYNTAVGAVSGTAEIYDPGGDQCLSASLNPSFRERWSDHYQVSVISVDDFVREQELTAVDLIKLDVEGFEECVFDGAQSTLARLKPAIMLELLPRASSRVLEHLEHLVTAGYGLFHLGPTGMIRRDVVERPSMGRNVLLCPPERLTRDERV